MVQRAKVGGANVWGHVVLKFRGLWHWTLGNLGSFGVLGVRGCGILGCLGVPVWSLLRFWGCRRFRGADVCAFLELPGFGGALARECRHRGARGVLRPGVSGCAGFRALRGHRVRGSGCDAGAVNSDGRAPHPRAGRAVFPSLLVGPSPGRGGPGRAGAALKAAAVPGPATCRRRPRPRSFSGTHREHTGPHSEPPLRELIGNRPGNLPDPPSPPGPAAPLREPTGSQPQHRELAPGQTQDTSPDSGNRDPYPGHRYRAANPSRDTGTETGPRSQAPVVTPGTGTLPEHRD